MSYYLAIVLSVIFAVLLFFKYVVIKRYAIKKALYYIVSIIGMTMFLLFLSNIYNFKLGRNFITLLILLPAGLMIAYCEKFFFKEEQADVVEQQGVTLQSEPITQNTIDYKKKFEEHKRMRERYASVPIEDIEKVVDELCKKTKREVIRIEIEDADNLPLTASKFGGMPYIPNGGIMPSDEAGRQLRLLAQLNMSELPSNDFMPKEGILQFWALNNNMVGLEPYHLTTKNTSRVVYYKTVDMDVTMEDVQQKYRPWYEEGHADYFPILNELALKFTLDEEGMGSEDFRWNKLFCELWNDKHPDLEVSDMDELSNSYSGEYRADGNHKIGGYPSFAQRDFRGNGDETSLLLLQICATLDLSERITKKSQVCRINWGDFGICNFFIKADDLAKLDFSNVIYHWDCS